MYYIYHIKGKKIGCSINPRVRTKNQGFTDYEILEEHTDIYIASDRERELQKEWGYKVDTKPYYQTIKMATFESCSKSGKKHRDSGHIKRITELAAKKALKPIYQMDKLGNIIQEFESITLTSITLGLTYSKISKCCRGVKKTHGGFTFKYKNN